MFIRPWGLTCTELENRARAKASAEEIEIAKTLEASGSMNKSWRSMSNSKRLRISKKQPQY
jgi:muconolactone delta-isomerase